MRLSFSAFVSLSQRSVGSPLRLFVAVTLLFGTAFALLVPPFQIPDEYTHFTRAYEVSELKSADVYHAKQIDHLGSMMPKSIYLTYKQTSLHLAPHAPDVPQAKKYSHAQTKQALNIPLNQSSRIFYDTGASPSYFPGLYIPQAITIGLLKLFSAPVIIMLYATRFVGLLIWMALVCVALRYIRPTKRVLALTGVLLLPMFVAQASASTDPLINGLVVLYVALISNFFIEKAALSPRRALLLGAMLTLMTLSKPVYAVFGLLLLLLRSSEKKQASSTAYKIGALVLPILIFAAWSSLTKTPGGPYFIDSIAISHADPSQQAAHLVPNLLNFAQPFINTLFLNWGDNVFVSLIGEFGKLDTPLPLLFVILGYVVILVAAFSSSKDTNEQILARNFYQKKQTVVLMALMSLLYIGGVYLAMYVYSTPPEEKIVTGVQGRYFLPLLPVFVLLFSKNQLTIRERLYRYILTLGPVLLLTASLVVIYLRFYILYPK